MATASGHSEVSEIGSEIGFLFLEEAVGGLVFGFVLGFVGLKWIQSLKDNSHLAVMVSLAIVMGGYAVASILHISGPLAMVVAGLLIGNKININATNKNELQKILNEFWEILDDIFNGILFVLIGLAVHLLEFNQSYSILGLIATVIVLLSRYISVFIPYSLLKHTESSSNKTVAVLTWGGLRGGISIALALSLSNDLSSDIILYITFVVVLFSIIVQGLSIGAFVKKLYR